MARISGAALCVTVRTRLILILKFALGCKQFTGSRVEELTQIAFIQRIVSQQIFFKGVVSKIVNSFINCLHTFHMQLFGILATMLTPMLIHGK